MIVGVSTFELHLPEVRSLKEKRKVVKGLIDRIHHRFRVSISETGHQDLHQRAEISVAAVGRSQSEMEQLLEGVRRIVDHQHEAVLTEWNPQFLEGE